jgi:hypothetical protein
LKHDQFFEKAEVRHTGTGLHLLFWFDEPVEIESAGDLRAEIPRSRILNTFPTNFLDT